MSRLRKCPEMDFRGNSPFWLKNEGFGLTLYFPAFRPESEYYSGDRGGAQLVFGVLSDNVPMSFVIAMMEQGKLDGHLQKSCWIRPEVTPSGRIVMAFSCDKWNTKDEVRDAWHITQDAYNKASSWYHQKVKELWEQAKLAASFFGSMPGMQKREDDDTINVQVVEPAQIES